MSDECFEAEAEVTPGSFGDRACFNGGIYVLGFDFTHAREIVAGATISSATIADDPESGSAITFGATSIAGAIVSFLSTMPANGSGAIKHCLRCEATLSTGAKIIGCGRVICGDC